jgi:hypothetical protein
MPKCVSEVSDSELAMFWVIIFAQLDIEQADGRLCRLEVIREVVGHGRTTGSDGSIEMRL